jgi:hypothetical protein
VIPIESRDQEDTLGSRMSRPQTGQELRAVHLGHPLPGENDGDSVVVAVHRHQVVQHVGCRTPGEDLIGAPVPARDIGDEQLKIDVVIIDNDDAGPRIASLSYMPLRRYH